ncbi:MAG: VapC toxin family PIN domain ribonuclease [Pedosphaera sp.]|nr:VapC toxin family PIN domain ribonuclease [Pedosphaera sp.]
MVLVDSSVWIEAGRRDGKLEVKVALEGLLEEYEALWCGLVKLEVLGSARSEERKRLDEFFECIPYKPMPDEGWEFAKECARRLRDKGLNIPATDILIASLVVTLQCRVYAVDQHFDLMAPVLGFQLYQPGYGGKFNPGTEA